MNILIIDTSSWLEIISIYTDSGVSNHSKFVEHSHSTTIFENIDACLKDLGIKINDIELIGVGIGPGSFTGIRIAVSTARMLAQVLDIPLVGIKSQMILASSVNTDENNNILVAFDAKKGRVFGGLYKKTVNHLPETIIEEGDYNIEFLISNIDKNYKTITIGDGAEKYNEIIKKSLADVEHMGEFIPSCENSARLIMETFKSNPQTYSDYNSTKPFYARKSDAELLKEK